MQRERGKKRDKSKKEKSSGGRQNRWAEAGGAGSGKGGKRKRQRGSKLSNKQEKAKGKAQESRHQNRFPPLFDRAPPFTFEHQRSRGLFRKSKFITLICYFPRGGFWLASGMGGGADRGQGAPSAALCLLSVSESACEGSQPSSSPSALRASRSMIWVVTSEPGEFVELRNRISRIRPFLETF